tara:strand:+ start:5684 stop:6373 length:690 start_codon:yes stop_codon:yes gene_type:complete
MKEKGRLLSRELLRSSVEDDKQKQKDYCDRLNGKKGKGLLPADAPKDIDFFLHFKVKLEEYRDTLNINDMKIIDDFFAFRDGICYEDLAPDITRQRLVIEGELKNAFSPEEMKQYCKEISKELDMTPVSKPETNFAEEYGWCCYMHWRESGMHIYSWENRKPPFFSVDIYTCKTFAWGDAVRFTESFFGDDLIKITSRPDGGRNGSKTFEKRHRLLGAQNNIDAFRRSK